MKVVNKIISCSIVTIWILVLSLLGGANVAFAATAGVGCDSSHETNKPAPLAGIWEIHTYKEIAGNKSYFQAGDYVLIEPTEVPGQACIEFSSFVEGNFYYYVAIDETGTTIDDNVVTQLGKNLRILVQRVGNSVSVVLFTTVDGSGPFEGGEEQGGGMAGSGRP